MAISGEEIRARLSSFASRWSVYEGSERGEAQTFLNQLFECYGTSREEEAEFEHRQEDGGFVDLLWPRVCLIEMKAPAEAKRLSKHREQAFRYWAEAAEPEKNVPSPEWVVICAFRRLEVWQPGKFPKQPRVVLDLIDLPDQYDALLFLAGEEPVFAGGQAALTKEAVVHVVDLYERLRERRAADSVELRDFLLQCVWCMFAEDLGQLPEHRFTTLVEDLIADRRRSSRDELHGLFEALNTRGSRPEHGLYARVPYANGGLFERPARVHLESDELEHLRAAAGFQWDEVQPSIFGSLLEGGLGHDQQWRLGAHYTHEADIQKVVQPTIVEPWRERIENLSKHGEAVAAQNDLLNYVVLDPACGSGNFLYVAYRELRRLERRLHEREVELRRKEGQRDQGSLSLHFPLSNMRGIEIEPFAVALARVTLWMGHKKAVDELGLDEATLPLADLSGIQIGDALRIEWPRADAIIGNPPFHGASNVRSLLGDAYVEWLKAEFDVGVKDYCVYWFRKTHERLEVGGRAGLVGTNSIAQNFGRGASLAYIADNDGTIVDAVSTQDWPGEAAVDVSIVNWVKGVATPPFRLDGRGVPGITTSLRSTDRPDVSTAEKLALNAGSSFEGVKPGGRGFLLDENAALGLLADKGVNYEVVVRPYLVGDDIARDPQQSPTRWIIDFQTMTLEEAMEYPAALEIVRKNVKPVRDKNRREVRRVRWWMFSEPVPAMRTALAPLSRFIASNAQGKRLFFCWCEPRVCASNLTKVFAFEDDYSMAVLSSSLHHAWARAQSSTLEDRFRYTPTSAFETFPWPSGNRDEVADLSRRLIERRSEICLDRQIGLTKLYNQVDEGAWADLRELHVALDEAVAVAYGWPRSVAHDPDESNRRLLELNRAIAVGEVEYHPFGD